MNVKFFLPGKPNLLIGEYEIKEDFSYEVLFDLNGVYEMFIDKAIKGELEVDYIEKGSFEKKTMYFENKTNDLEGFCEGIKKFMKGLGVLVLCDLH